MTSENRIQSANDCWISIGECLKTHGLKGGMVFRLFNIRPQDTILRNNLNIRLYPTKNNKKIPSNGIEYKIQSINIAHKVIVYLETIDTIEQAQELIPFEIRVSREEFPEIESENEYYDSDLVGMNIIDHHTKKRVGEIAKIYSNGVQDIISIDLLNGEKIDLPFTKNFFPTVELDQGPIRSDHP